MLSVKYCPDPLSYSFHMFADFGLASKCPIPHPIHSFTNVCLQMSKRVKEGIFWDADEVWVNK